MQGKRKRKIGAIKEEDGKIMTDAKEKAERFNQFFAKIGGSLAAKIQVELPGNLNEYIHHVVPTLQSIQIDKTVVKNAIEKIVKLGKSYGSDNISPRELKLTGDSLLPGLSFVMDRSLRCATYLNQWKLSKVKAVSKKGNSSEIGNYRPISLLGIPSKVYEGIIAESIDKHFIDRGLVSTNQWGFVKARSTKFLVLHLTEEWRKAVDEKETYRYNVHKLQKGFDSICHKIMALKF